MNGRIAGFTALERLEPCAGKLACTVLRGAGNSNVASLLDFAFLGHQVPLEINERTYFIDMLFYHVKLHCYVVTELKATAFKPEYAGKLNFYLSAVDDILRSSQDNPSIGLLLCKTSDKILAEYSLRNINKPIGVSEYTLTKALPKNLKTDLPTISEIEAELSKKKST